MPEEVWRDREPGASARPLPAHSLVVFVPLCDVSAANGATAFLPGSHAPWTAAALRAETDAPGSSSAGAPAVLSVAAGDAIVFDSRTQHAGGGNATDDVRPILYYVYARPWFDDELHRELVGGGDATAAAARLFPEFLR